MLSRPADQPQPTSARREYGDFQTPCVLTERICATLADRGLRPQILVEPTFGRGAFLLSAIRHFPTLQTVYGVELYEPYYWDTQCALLEWAIRHPGTPKPQIHLSLQDVFRVDFGAMSVPDTTDALLVLGNPPWVTNTALSKLQAANLPDKRNFRRVRGIEALTGKSNFDISENILLMLLSTFARRPGHLAMLVKTAVLQRLVYEVGKLALPLTNMTALTIDARKYFRAFVQAALFEADFQAQHPTYTCRVGQFAVPSPPCDHDEFGWVAQKFVAHTQHYRAVSQYDGQSPYVWRQGVKHDCAKVMELRRVNGHYINGLHETLELEDALIYGLLKSADLQDVLPVAPQRAVIIPQTYIGEETASIARHYPRLAGYLRRHQRRFAQRKSRIYHSKPEFSIFGIGAYAFRPYKVAISGLYKRSHFSLVLPEPGPRPVMLDDTCYFLGFETLTDALFVWALLNGELVQQLLRSIVFPDAKRMYTKQRLMRIDLARIAKTVSYQTIDQQLQTVAHQVGASITARQWQCFVDAMT